MKHILSILTVNISLVLCTFAAAGDVAFQKIDDFNYKYTQTAAQVTTTLDQSKGQSFILGKQIAILQQRKADIDSGISQAITAGVRSENT